ncbi:hypothetical protein V8E54_011265 [Elaphomyces granulatus]
MHHRLDTILETASSLLPGEVPAKALLQTRKTLGIGDVLMTQVRRWASSVEPPFRQQPVFKRGRSTGTTAGYTERITSNLRIEGWSPSVTALAVLITSWPLPPPIVATPRLFTGLETTIQPVFARPGDSGSWVLNASGELIGLLFAGSLLTPECYMLPIEVVCHDIITRFRSFGDVEISFDID